MKVYIVEAENVWYDDYDTIVVVAENEKRAIEIAGDKERGQYFRSDQHPLTATEADLNKEGIIHDSFNAG